MLTYADRLTAFMSEMLTDGLKLEDIKKQTYKLVIVAALKMKRGNQCHAAQMLNVHRNTLGRLIVEHQIDVEEIKHKYRRSRKSPNVPPETQL